MIEHTIETCPVCDPPEPDGDPEIRSSGDPEIDFVWVGCRTCWWPKDPNRPVVTYQQWLDNTMRHMGYRCRVCSENLQRPVDVFPSAWGFPMSAAVELLPGGPQPETLETWGEPEA